jgi:hypothetical protein
MLELPLPGVVLKAAAVPPSPRPNRKTLTAIRFFFISGSSWKCALLQDAGEELHVHLGLAQLSALGDSSAACCSSLQTRDGSPDWAASVWVTEAVASEGWVRAPEQMP